MCNVAERESVSLEVPELKAGSSRESCGGVAVCHVCLVFLSGSDGGYEESHHRTLIK